MYINKKIRFIRSRKKYSQFRSLTFNERKLKEIYIYYTHILKMF